MNRFSWQAAETRIYGLYGAQIQAWVAARRGSNCGVVFRSTAPYGRGRGWSDGRCAYVHGRDETAAFFEALAGTVENACRSGGVVDVVSDWSDYRPGVGIHDDAWTPSPSHNSRPAAGLAAKLAAGGGLRLVAIRSWQRTVPSAAAGDRTHYARNAVLCVFETRQAEFLAESLRRFAKM